MEAMEISEDENKVQRKYFKRNYFAPNVRLGHTRVVKTAKPNCSKR